MKKILSNNRSEKSSSNRCQVQWQWTKLKYLPLPCQRLVSFEIEKPKHLGSRWVRIYIILLKIMNVFHHQAQFCQIGHYTDLAEIFCQILTMPGAMLNLAKIEINICILTRDSMSLILTIHFDLSHEFAHYICILSVVGSFL